MAHRQVSYILNTITNGMQKVVLNRPAKKNALMGTMYKELTTLLNDSAKNKNVTLFVLTSNGTFFSSGNDIQDSIRRANFGSSVDEANFEYKEFVDALIKYPKLLVAVVNGPAIGIACTMLGLFDMVYASDKAYFHTPFTSLGLLAEGCSTYTFPRLFGSKAGDMLYLGYKMDVYEAKQYGLVSEVYKHDSLEEVWDYLNIFLKLSSEAILAIKQLVNKWTKDTLLEVNAEEAKALRKQLESPDVVERFLDFLKRKNKL